jgi:FKBP-type peptidyl-prolyl cis-trans isomerase
VRTPLLAVVLAAALAGCGGSSSGGENLQSDAGDSPTTATTQGPIGPVAGSSCTNDATAGAVTTTTDLSKKPVVEVPDGPLPCELAVRDIVEGSGPAAKAGDQLTMKYVGVTWSTGKQFDASWDSGQDFPFVLGAGNVIRGWDEGMVGMKAGGRRQLVIPPDLAYGDQDQGPDLPANSTLIFVVDLVKIG